MDSRSSIQQVPLHLTSLTILSPNNAPLYVHSFTGEQDQLSHYHLGHAAVDVIEERIVMTSTPTKPADSYLGLLFCMEDMAFYGFQTPTKLRMVLSVALVDAMIKDADIVAIFRAVHQLVLSTTNNPFLSLPPTFHAKPAIPAETDTKPPSSESIINPQIPASKMFATSPEDIKAEWFRDSKRFNDGIKAIGELLSGGR
ncbi:hypothetical protein L202_00670 [Cryptococcus amylolentus CBS 6039]|uniref:Sedlin n=2 Tax=Cryptococcus amylolentus TaxID=104669 RepID=A0A1E3I852_9TREE|nr:hypothetical protein L202_00670 [Cryptococcus amylolentus CBS 6039]ODN84800.1 hypothetical protein L202_00670 [Cryptococcus amylolentus CBS 6039]ODO11475.1 hypothetical protein I350_00255 [Cryptococcus amylolentus CBS 6273]